MRISTSVRFSSGSSGRMLAACSGSRCESTIAAICGCSSPMMLATALASIHFSASMPCPLCPFSTRSSSMSAFCLPTACVSTRLTYSGEAEVTLARPSATSMKLPSTALICSRDTCLSSAMARPSFCTSRASSCLSRLAASCSPRLISRIAARSVPARSSGLSAIRRHPLLHDLRRTLRILSNQRAGRGELLLERGLQRNGPCVLRRQTDAVAGEIPTAARGAPLGERLHQRSQDEEGHQQHQADTDRLLGELSHPRVFPDRRARGRAARQVRLEGLVEHRELIAAL